jgi:hypothetical protein
VSDGGNGTAEAQIMQQTFRVTYARTSYMEIELSAEDCHDAERLFEAIATAEPLICERGKTVIKPNYRIVDVVETADARASSPLPPALAAA